MVIIRTSATEVKTHAVSPELTVHFSATVAEHAGGAAGAAAGARAGGGGGGVGWRGGSACRRGSGGGRRCGGSRRGGGSGRGWRGGGVILRHRDRRSEANEHGRCQRGSEASQYSW